MGVRLNLLRWETHAFPAIGNHPQELINSQIGDDFDIFIGIMWGKFGSPTEESGSGTEEEFFLAKRRYDADSGSIKIMFYFKDTPLPPSKIDTDQLKKVQDFKSTLGKKGVLYWGFSTIEDFGNLLRLHLSKQIQSFISESSSTLNPDNAIREDTVSETDEDEIGILDLIEMFNERMTITTEITQRITVATSDFASKMRVRTNEINEAFNVSGGQILLSDAKKLTNKVADDMKQYVIRTSTEIPILRTAFREGMCALGKAASITVVIDKGDLEQVRTSRDAINNLETEFSTAYNATSQFRETIQSFPRISTNLNKAKRLVSETLDELLRGLDEMKRDAEEAGKLIDVLLKTRGE